MPHCTKSTVIEQIFKPDETGKSNWVDKDVWRHLTSGDNGQMRHGVPFGSSGKRWKWEAKRKNGIKTGKIIAFRTTGFEYDPLKYHPISDDIRKNCIKMPCVSCGSTSNIVPDHKNDSYKDLRVLSKKTQRRDDFQPLCPHCNLQKRETTKKSKETGKRYRATNVPIIKAMFGDIDYTEGSETYDYDSDDPMKGTYWHDCVAFIEEGVRLQRADEANQARTPATIKTQMTKRNETS